MTVTLRSWHVQISQSEASDRIQINREYTLRDYSWSILSIVDVPLTGVEQ
jgi:hypothetical protein